MKYFHFSLFVLSSSLLMGAHSHEPLTIFTGDLASPGQIKYIVSINFNGVDICSGGIIAKQFVLSVAHCFIDYTNSFQTGNYTIKAGVNDLTDRQAIEVNVQIIYIPQYFNGTRTYFYGPHFDIAVLKLSKKLDLDHDERLQALILPKLNIRFRGLNTTVAGFGLVTLHKWIRTTNIEPGNAIQTVSKLHTAEASVLQNNNCHENYYPYMTTANICAKIIKDESEEYNRKCIGDSGSPLVYGSNLIVGLFSLPGPSCEKSSYPGLYTRVSSYLTFIKNATREIGCHTRTLIPENEKNLYR